jgi:vacuolar-type H+-ATPase subunit E/Vma4
VAIAELIAGLEQDAERQRQAIRRDAAAEALAIETAATQAVAEIASRHLEQERARRRATADQALTRARHEARARELAAQHALIARILSRARTWLPAAAASREYLDVLPSQLAEALSFLEGVPARVRCPSALVAPLRVALDRQDVAVAADESVAPGFIVEAIDGSVAVDQTLTARLARIERRLVIELWREVNDARA